MFYIMTPTETLQTFGVATVFIQMCYDDLNPETLYKLALLILYDADFDRNNNCFGDLS